MNAYRKTPIIVGPQGSGKTLAALEAATLFAGDGGVVMEMSYEEFRSRDGLLDILNCKPSIVIVSEMPRYCPAWDYARRMVSARKWQVRQPYCKELTEFSPVPIIFVSQEEPTKKMSERVFEIVRTGLAA